MVKQDCGGKFHYNSDFCAEIPDIRVEVIREKIDRALLIANRLEQLIKVRNLVETIDEGIIPLFSIIDDEDAESYIPFNKNTKKKDLCTINYKIEEYYKEVDVLYVFILDNKKYLERVAERLQISERVKYSTLLQLAEEALNKLKKFQDNYLDDNRSMG